MIKLICFFTTALITTSLAAEELATCRDPIGKAYFHFVGLISKKDSGWSNDGIRGGTFTLVQLPDSSFDLLYVDTRKKPISSVQDGAVVRLLVQGTSTLTVLVYYKNVTTEIYTFFKNKEGQSQFTMLTSRSGDDVPISKSALLTGPCDTIRFDLVK